MIVLVLLCSALLFGCGGTDIDMSMDNGNVEGNEIVVSFHLDEKVSDGYKLKGSFHAESKADLDKR